MPSWPICGRANRWRWNSASRPPSRTSESLEAEWPEFDLEKKVWTIPAKRMKAGQEHRIPLTDRALDILKGLPKLDHNSRVFPGNAKGQPL